MPRLSHFLGRIGVPEIVLFGSNSNARIISYNRSMSDVTRILSQIESGDSNASSELLPLVYEELRKLAAAKMSQEKPGQTLQATALVHEAFMRLVDQDHAPAWENRGHFFAAASEAMRRILINRARDKNRIKRGGGLKRVDLDSLTIATDAPSGDLLIIDEALTDLAREDPVSADLVKMRFFGGLTLRDAGDALGLKRHQADKHWASANAWLWSRLRGDASSE